MRSTPFYLALFLALCVPAFAFGQSAPSQPLKAKHPVTALVDQPDTIPTADFDYDKQPSAPLTPLNQVKPANTTKTQPVWVFTRFAQPVRRALPQASTAKAQPQKMPQ